MERYEKVTELFALLGLAAWLIIGMVVCWKLELTTRTAPPELYGASVAVWPVVLLIAWYISRRK